MATTIPSAFQKLKANLEITGLQKSTISARQQNVRKAIEEELTVLDSFLTGSYSRSTLIAPLNEANIDIFIVLDSSYYHDLGGPANLLAKVKRVLRKTYPNTPDISRNGQAVTIQFTDFMVDVVPESLVYNSNFLYHNNCIMNQKKPSQKYLFSDIRRSRQKVSFSEIATFMRCPYEYKNIFIDRARNNRRCGAKLSLGISLHASLRDFYRISFPEDRSLDNLLLSLKRNWSSKDFINPDEEQMWLNRAKDILSNFYSQNDHRRTPCYVEQRFVTKLDDLVFVGVIDRIDKVENTYELIDYKLEDYQEKEIEDLQMTFYYIGCKYGLGIDIETFTFYILEENRKKHVVLTPAQIEKNIRRIKSCISEIDGAEIFAPKINILCENCGLKASCPAYAVTVK